VVATADSPDSVDVLELAGADRVLQLGPLLGKAFARRILSPHARSSVISEFEDLVIAEAAVAGTDLVGCSIAELGMREQIGVSVVGVWERGSLRSARPQQRIQQHSVLILAGTEEQMVAYDDWYEQHAGAEESTAAGGDAVEQSDEESDEEPHVVILGGGRVGRAVAAELEQVGTRAIIVERLAERLRPGLEYVHGDAADREVLHEAGIERASAVVVTTHDDAMNIYLTLYCRRLRSDVQILGRTNLDRNVSTMHRAGADFVLSYAATGAIEAWNELHEDTTLLLAEGLLVFRVAMPPVLAGQRLRDTDIAATTGCTVIGVARDGECHTGVAPDETLPDDAELVLIGDAEAEQLFARRYGDARPRSAWERTRAWLREVTPERV
jgi:voltage-gated potassium channel